MDTPETRIDEFPEPSPVLQELGKMVEFALENPDKNQVPLNLRSAMSQETWEKLTREEQLRIQNNISNI